MANAKEFFLKRWMRSLIEWADDKFFPTAVDGKPTFSLVSQTFTVSFIAGVIIGICTMISNGGDGPLVGIVSAVASAAVLLLYVLYIIKDIKRFETTGMKVGRGIYVFILNSITASVAMTLAVFVLVAVIFIAVVYFLLGVIFGFDSNSGKKKKYRLDNGDEVTEESGLLGEKYYTGTSGKSYDKVSDDTFTEK